MKKLVRKQVGTKKEKKIIKHEDKYDEFGNLVEAYEEVIEVDVPVFGNVYEEMTQEEILSLKNEVSDNIEPTIEERLEAMESAMLEMIIMGGAL